MFSGAVLVRSDAQFDFEELSLIAFALGVGVGEATARLFVIFAFDLGMVVAAFGLGVGVGLCCLYIFDLLLLRLVALGFGVGVGCPALAAPMLPARAIAVIANVFRSVFLIFILPTTKSIAVRAPLFLSFCRRILCSPANHRRVEQSEPPLEKSGGGSRYWQ
jgi:hypothetical protein